MSRQRFWRLCFIQLVAWCLAGSSASALDYVWKAPPAQGSVLYQYYWGNTNYWEPGGVPIAIDSAQILAGMCQVVDRAEVDSLKVSSAILFGPGPVVVQDLIVSGGQLADASDLNYTNYPTGDHAIEFHETGHFSGTIGVRMKMKNYGDALTTNATLRALSTLYEPPSSYGARWFNYSGSSLTIGGQTLFIYSSYPMQQYISLVNELGAEITKTGTNTSRVEWRLSGQGSVHVQNGMLQFNYPQEINGPMMVDAGAVLRFDNSVEDLTIGQDATFDGNGRLEFSGANDKVLLMGETVVNCVTLITNGIWEGEKILFTRPTDWKGTTWISPVQFLFGGTGSGSIQHSMINFGPMTDFGIASAPGTWALNVPPSYYYTSNSFPGSFYFQGTNETQFGWFTNALGATVHFKAGPSLPSIKWNLHNEGVVRFDAGTKPRFPGSFTQGSSGTTELSGQQVGIQGRLVLEGNLTGWGAITSHNVRVTGTLSPSSTNGPFGRLELRAENSIFVAFPTNRITAEPSTVFDVDLGAPGTTNDFFLLSGPNLNIAGTVNIRARDGFGPGSYPFFSTRFVNLQFGTVPPGYRYAFGTNGNQLTIVVSRPEVPTVSLEQNFNGTNGVTFVLNTISNANYKVDYTDDLTQPWQLWTNIMGNGGQLTFPIAKDNPSKFFKVTEQ